jgi:hypothetical protein
MISNLGKYLPEEILGYYELMRSFKTLRDEWRYRFISDDDFRELTDLTTQAKVYWSEMLCRTHIVVLVSWFKALRWLESLNNNIDNFYGFCSNLRSLIESCADSFYTLRFAPLTISKDYRAIYESIHNNSPIFLTHEPLEKILLHFIQGTKLSKEQRQAYPSEYNAKQIVEYLSSIEGGNEKIIQLYGYLCGVSHPAYESTQLFLFLHNSETIVCGDSYDLEKKMIQDLLKCFEDSILIMFRVFMVNSLSTLNTLNYFNLPDIHSEIDVTAVEGHPSWKEVSQYMEESNKKYLEAMQSGIYE